MIKFPKTPGFRTLVWYFMLVVAVYSAGGLLKLLLTGSFVAGTYVFIPIAIVSYICYVIETGSWSV